MEDERKKDKQQEEKNAFKALLIVRANTATSRIDNAKGSLKIDLRDITRYRLRKTP